MTETTLRRTLPEAYTIGAPGADVYWAFLEGGAGVLCARYLDGEYIEDFAETADLPGIADARVVLVAERYLLVNPKDGSALYVWDLVGDSVAEYLAPAGYQIAGAGAINGAVYWIEWPEQDWAGGPVTYVSEIRLMSAGFSLADPTAEGSVEVSDNFWWEWRAPSPAYWFALNSAAALAARAAWDVINNEVTKIYRVRFPLSGGAGSSAAGGTSAENGGFDLGVPDAAGGSFCAAINDTTTLLRLEDDVDTATLPVGHWPAETEWQLEATVNVALSPDENEAIAFGQVLGNWWLLRGDVDGGAAPRKSFAVEDHPVELATPLFMFPRSA